MIVRIKKYCKTGWIFEGSINLIYMVIVLTYVNMTLVFPMVNAVYIYCVHVHEVYSSFNNSVPLQQLICYA
jgi:hypothetical protein